MVHLKWFILMYYFINKISIGVEKEITETMQTNVFLCAKMMKWSSKQER